MLQDLAALAPPAIVCVAFLVGAWVLVRKELAPKRRARAQAGRAQAAAAVDEREREHADHEHGAS
jgi:ABC-type nickel/cobalt efflux system permease component RcnA